MIPISIYLNVSCRKYVIVSAHNTNIISVIIYGTIMPAYTLNWQSVYIVGLYGIGYVGRAIYIDVPHIDVLVKVIDVYIYSIYFV